MGSFADKAFGVLKSRRFYAAIANVVFIHFGLAFDLSLEEIAIYSAPIIAWIIGDSLQKTETFSNR